MGGKAAQIVRKIIICTAFVRVTADCKRNASQSIGGRKTGVKENE